MSQGEVEIGSGAESARASSLLWWVCLASGLALLVIHNWSVSPWMLDDAFISFRYSENFASGHGLVFNIGEHVEGYTTFLWVFLLGVGNWIGLEMIGLSKILGWGCALGSVLLIAYSHRLVKGIDKTTSALAVLLLCSCGVFTPWPSSGMEVCLFGCLISAAITAYASHLVPGGRTRGLLVGGLVSLAIMTRPEGVLLAGVIAVHAAFRRLTAGDRTVWWYVGAMIILYGGYFVWRYSYYGYLLPNTFYAKVGTTSAQVSRGVDYLIGLGEVVWPMLLLVGFSIWKSALRSRFMLLSFGYLFLHLIYVLLVGGDCMPAFRFLAPLLPCLAVLGGFGLARLPRRSVAILVTMLVIGFNAYQMFSAFAITGHIRADKVAVRGKEVGLWLKENLPASSLVATNTAGTIPYFSGLPVVDMLGLNDTTIAHREIADMGVGLAGHEKGDGAYVLSRRPAVIQFHSSLGRLEPSFRSDRELYAMPEFHLKYRAVEVLIPSLGETAVFYVRKDLSFVKR